MSTTPQHFIRQIIAEDVAQGRCPAVVTRFPPEPNGYLHIGHAKAICLDFGMAREFGGRCHLRYDDTNPANEDVEYVSAIEEDVRWLGFDWGPHLYYAADYFEQMYGYAEELIERGLAYVCTLTPEEFKAYRGVPTRPGQASPWRDRPVAENLALFRRMRAGEFPDGAYVLRAKIDMSAPNLHLRDPALYRIKHVPHHRTGDRWCLYPTYDFAHPLEDAIEGVTHSLCTLEFEVHRPLYDWILENVSVPGRPRQYEFARLNLSYTLMSKRKLLELVRAGRVAGWDDPRLPTLCGLRRRGYPAEAIRTFCERIGVTKYESLTDIALLEHAVREVLNRTAPRRFAVRNPLKLVITNLPPDHPRAVQAVNNPEDPAAGQRPLPFGNTLWIERDDFLLDPPKKFHRLAPGREVRLRYAGLFTCTEALTDPAGEVTEVRGTFDLDSWGGNAPDGRKVRGTIHWVAADQAVRLPVRLYDRLFTVADLNSLPDDQPWTECLNPDSLIETEMLAEPDLATAQPGAVFQFERLGYFCADSRASQPGAPVFNQTVSLKDSWSRQLRQ